VRSALGSFVLHHFGDQLDAFKRLVAKERQQLRPILVERETSSSFARVQTPDPRLRLR
jgi:hypothetical protein